jgi:hypothetical protein
MKRISLLFTALVVSLHIAFAQDEETGLQISGSVDTYWKYDFSGNENIGTSFANEQNSISIGMIDLALSQTIGKASFVGEISFGPRGQYQSIPNGNGTDDNSFHIQNLYVSYALTEKLSLTAGYMGTFVGYEVISPAGNFNYSTSYLFTNGPFQNAGIKAQYAFSDRVSLMVGLFNDWNVYTDFNGVSDIGAQLHLTPVDDWNVYFNYISGYNYSVEGNLSEFDITTGFQVTDGFYLGANFATASAKNDDTDLDDGFTGFALYPQLAFSDAVAFGIRYENFAWKDATSYNAFTFSLPLTSGPLTVIPEFRIDSASDDVFEDSDLLPVGSTSQFLIAAVYAF